MSRGIILRKREVAEGPGLSDTTIWRLERGGKFPPRALTDAGSVGWREDEIEDWVHNRIRAPARPRQPQGARSRAALDLGCRLMETLDD